MGFQKAWRIYRLLLAWRQAYTQIQCSLFGNHAGSQACLSCICMLRLLLLLSFLCVFPGTVLCCSHTFTHLCYIIIKFIILHDTVILMISSVCSRASHPFHATNNKVVPCRLLYTCSVCKKNVQ